MELSDLSFTLKQIELETLVILVERGPLSAGSLLLDSATQMLISYGLAVPVIFQSCDGYYAATYEGRDLYKHLYGGDTVEQGRQRRLALSRAASARTIQIASADQSISTTPHCTSCSVEQLGRCMKLNMCAAHRVHIWGK
jgi:hypothetical protein